MSDPSTDTAQRARDLAQEIRAGLARLERESADLGARLAQLETLLGSEPASGTSQNAEILRAALETATDRFARLNSLMVHEIRKPMTSIRGYADMLAKPGMIGPLNEMQQQFVSVIRNNVLAMESLVTNISDLSKLTTGRIRLEAKMTTVSQVMIEVQKQAEALNAEFQHTLTLDAPSGMPVLNVDIGALAKVMQHLVRNAMMYTPKGGQITISAERLEENRVRLAVRDTGIGMTPEVMSHLGEPFYRGDHELVTSQKGYGLGIPVAMGFLKLMDSTLTYDSVPEQGSTFSFVIAGMG
jgi:signal transduction histidine kinase